jgi:hypothetical protein
MEYMQLLGINPWELFPLYLQLIGVWTNDDNSKFWTGSRFGLQMQISKITWTGHVTSLLIELDLKLDPLCMNPNWECKRHCNQNLHYYPVNAPTPPLSYLGTYLCKWLSNTGK